MQPAIAPRDDGHVPADTDKIVGRSKLLGELRELIRRRHYSIRTEIERLFAQMDGTPKLVAALLYGAGLRLLSGHEANLTAENSDGSSGSPQLLMRCE